MKKKVSKQDLRDYVRHLDTRCKRYEDSVVDQLIEDGFAVVNEVGPIFFDEDALQIKEYIEDGVQKMSYDVERDVVYIYDAFISQDSIHPIEYSDNYVEVDPRVVGRINLDFTSKADMYKRHTFHHPLDAVGNKLEVLIVKFAFIPTIEFENLFLTREEHKCFRAGVAVAVYDYLREEIKMSGFQKSLERTYKSINNKEPLDFEDSLELRKFDYGC